MHIISRYRAPHPINNGHYETIVPYYLRRVAPVPFERERIDTKDGDFLDLDWSKKQNNKLVIVSHGMEGSTDSNYIKGLTHYLNERGYDVLAWNHRGCSEETNRLLPMYHSGASYDLRDVVHHVLDNHGYEHIDLVGYSLGGNVTLKFTGEESKSIDDRIKRVVAVSVPVSLTDCNRALSEGLGPVYTKNFILKMIKKLKAKKQKFDDYNPNLLDIARMWNFRDFDNAVTAPLHGFKDAEDYWQKSSSLNVVQDINVPTLILNAKNDPFLKGKCFPYEETKNHPHVHLEAPDRGGHVGFVGKKGVWSEERIFEFLME